MNNNIHYFPSDFDGKREMIRKVRAVLISSTLGPRVAGTGSFEANIKDDFMDKFPDFDTADATYMQYPTKQNKANLELKMKNPTGIIRPARHFVKNIVDVARDYSDLANLDDVLDVLELLVQFNPKTPGFASPDTFEFTLRFNKSNQFLLEILVDISSVLNGSDKVHRFLRIILLNPTTREIVGEIHIERGRHRNVVELSNYQGCIAKVEGDYMSSRGQHGLDKVTHEIIVPGIFNAADHQTGGTAKK